MSEQPATYAEERPDGWWLVVGRESFKMPMEMFAKVIADVIRRGQQEVATLTAALAEANARVEALEGERDMNQSRGDWYLQEAIDLRQSLSAERQRAERAEAALAVSNPPMAFHKDCMLTTVLPITMSATAWIPYCTCGGAERHEAALAVYNTALTSPPTTPDASRQEEGTS